MIGNDNLALVHRLSYASVSHRGVVRPTNEDSLVADSPVFCVADGIGGQDAGEIASAIAADELATLATRDEPIDAEVVGEALRRAHERILQLHVNAESSRRRRAATTAAGCIATQVDETDYWLIFNVGDSRVYRCSGAAGSRRIRQISVDHSLVQELVDAGQVNKSDAYLHPRRNIVTRALGSVDGWEPDFWLLPMTAGERIVLCTDGLLTDSDSERVREIIKTDPDAGGTVRDLLDLALRSGARDNVSVIVIDVESVDDVELAAGPVADEASDAVETAESVVLGGEESSRTDGLGLLPADAGTPDSTVGGSRTS